MLNQFTWVIYPYLCLSIFVIGHIARYKYCLLYTSDAADE